MTIIYYIMIAIFGLCVGSFLNVVIYRVPNKMSIVKPNSHCTKCGNFIKWYDNIPILSYIILGGKCRYCKEPISIRYLFVEFLNALLWVLCYYVFSAYGWLTIILMMLVTSVLIIVAFIDLSHLIILDRFQIILLIIGVLLCAFSKDLPFSDRVIGFAVGGGIMLIFYGLGYLIAKREALGIGDIKLMAVCGLIMGYQNVLLSLMIASIVGAITLLILNKNQKDKEYPFAPFLCFGVLISILFGNIIINGYFSLF